MKYCSKCKKLYYKDQTVCGDCGQKLTDDIKDNDYVFLIEVSDDELENITLLLKDKNIKYNCCNENDKTSITVEYNKLSAAQNLLVKDGILEDIKLEEVADSNEYEEMSPAKRSIVKIVSAVLFMLIVWATVSGVDMIAEFIQNIFKR